ncbi:uncharacterized protein Z520_01965 [Fonsecaea multimorphosa CBS 102226]|uniref:Peptidase A2 domain-containing protein n=1 Tax=Fonsecaea multimorphosa CBS 102226 TaxID=1442371 RepID=A0A0D2IXR6_9EURO|nr:uncharacterized protein Z520_01965 [Fonsecaea multimorphosa CBS 102226]KIY01827.1 hypothetical protein Z520_01965 [Fonsecaea multimorphosa CBS 102226]
MSDLTALPVVIPGDAPTPLPARSKIKAHLQVRSYIDIDLNGFTKPAVADTGAQENVMSAELATSLRLIIKQPASGYQVPEFVNPVGKSMMALGYVCVPCRFKGEVEEIAENRFWVLPKMIVPLVVGRKFLDITQSLTRFRHRLRKITTSFKGFGPRALHMELPRQRLRCNVGDEMVQTVPDTGSDLDLMSLSLAQSHHYPIRRFCGECELVQFADGSTRRLYGKVVVPFSIGPLSIERREREFYVLQGLTSPVLLGNSTLEEFDAFNAHQDEFVDLDDLDPFSDLYYIRWIQRNEVENFLEASFDDWEFLTGLGGNLSDPMQGHGQQNFPSRFRRWFKRCQGQSSGRCFSGEGTRTSIL